MEFISNLITAILATLSIFLFIPAGILAFATVAIIPPIISFWLLMKNASKYNDKKATLYVVMMHLFLILNCFAFFNRSDSNSTSDMFGNVGETMFEGAMFTLGAIICFILYSNSIFNIKKNQSYNQIEEENSVEDNTNKKLCLHCGTYNDFNETVCSKCNMNLPK